MVAGAAPAAAGAQDASGRYDPESPAGKEYAIPLEDARSDAGGGSPKGRGGTSEGGAPPLFGAGVEPAAGEGGDAGGGSGSAGKPEDRPGRGSGDAPARGDSSPPSTAPQGTEVRRSSVPPGDSAEPTALLIGFGAVALGLLAGVAMRRRRRDPAG